VQDKTRKNKDLGDRGEAIAKRHLESMGFRILDRNVRYKCGEIDIVAKRGREVHFVEVKARAVGGVGAALEAVDGRKRRRMRNAAELYLKDPRNKFNEMKLPPCYFSVIGINCDGERPRVECLLDAF